MCVLVRLDHRLARWLNDAAWRTPAGRGPIRLAAERLASVEVGLMLLLALRGRRSTAARVLGSVGVVYAATWALGRRWRRHRPFQRLEDVRALAPHAADRSFPSRHVASGVAMATVAAEASRSVAGAMLGVAGLLGLARVAAGLHYPSDVLAGAALGRLVGVALRRRGSHASRGSRG